MKPTDMTRGTQGRPASADLVKSSAEDKLDPLDRLKLAFDRATKQIAEVCPSGVDPVRVVRMAIAAVARDEKLARCTPASILMGTLQGAALGLDLNSSLQQAFLVPRKNSRKGKDGKWIEVYEAVFQMGYRGYIVLAHQAGAISASIAEAVFARDHFRARRSIPHDVFEHEICEDQNRGDLRGAYCLWTTPGGGRDYLYWPAYQLYEHRDRFAPRQMYVDGQFIADASKRPIVGPWIDHMVPMVRKTMVIQAAKNWPMSSEKLRQAIALDRLTEGADRPALTFVPMGGGNSPEKAREALTALGEDDPGQQVIDPGEMPPSDTNGSVA